VSCISLKGFVDETTKYELMKKAKFFLFPSREEGWGIALAEALYCECLGLCYELPHYRGLFKEYPEYIKLDDSKEMGERLVSKYSANPKADQQKFIKQYDDRLVVKSVLNQIDEG
jgi:glycosyltransferase involved in cell wall biosynthesis